MSHENYDQFEYDVALSFTSEDRAVAEEFSGLLRDKSITIFYDEVQADSLSDGDMLEHLVNLYKRKARYCVMFLSQDYPLKRWTEEEQTSVQELALRDAQKYIIAVNLDDKEGTGYGNLKRQEMERILNSLEGKLKETMIHPGPPPESHDLRSGNIASLHRKSKA